MQQNLDQLRADYEQALAGGNLERAAELAGDIMALEVNLAPQS